MFLELGVCIFCWGVHFLAEINKEKMIKIQIWYIIVIRVDIETGYGGITRFPIFALMGR